MLKIASGVARILQKNIKQLNMTWSNLTCLPMLASAYLLTQDPLMSETETNKTNERRRLKWGQGD